MHHGVVASRIDLHSLQADLLSDLDLFGDAIVAVLAERGSERLDLVMSLAVPKGRQDQTSPTAGCYGENRRSRRSVPRRVSRPGGAFTKA